MDFSVERVRENVRAASTEDLLDRATIYRESLEPDALPVIMEELKSRGVSAEHVVNHEGKRQDALLDERGLVRKCNECDRPAVVKEWGWHQLWDRIPIFPRVFWRCEVHRQSES